MQTALANAQWLAKHGATAAERAAAARHADAILALAATLSFDGRPIGEAFNDPRVPCCGRDAADCDC